MRQDVLVKVQKYCAYQERCQYEVRSKLLKMHVYGDELEEVMSHLIAENFLDETRFAESFARGKLINNNWGKIKIRYELLGRRVSDYDIQKALSQIDTKVYHDILQKLVRRKLQRLGSMGSYEKRTRTLRFASGKGFETSLINDLLDKELSRVSIGDAS